MKDIIYKMIKKMTVLTILTANIVTAVPWCYRGTIVEIADVSWGEASIINNYPGVIPGSIPAWVAGNVDMHITYTAINNYANTFVGGGGGFGGYSVPNSGEVIEIPYAPHNYITAPSLYNTSEGVKFKLKKCYTIPPMTITKDYVTYQPLPTGGTVPVYEIKYQTFSDIEPACQYWSAKIVDPDEDDDDLDAKDVGKTTPGLLKINAIPSNYCRSR